MPSGESAHPALRFSMDTATG